MIKLTRTSPFDGLPITMEINTTELKIDQWDFWDRAPGMPLVQDFFFECNADEREFILTGVTPDQWIKLFGEEVDQ